MIDTLSRVNLSHVRPLLGDLSIKYPGGLDWLERRLDGAAFGRASVHAIHCGRSPSALAILTPKGPHAIKLSTFIVAPPWRGIGLGRLLIDRLQQQWSADEIDTVHVTIDQDDCATQGFFTRAGFVADPSVMIPYGSGRHDRLYRWHRDAASRTAVGAN